MAGHGAAAHEVTRQRGDLFGGAGGFNHHGFFHQAPEQHNRTAGWKVTGPGKGQATRQCFSSRFFSPEALIVNLATRENRTAGCPLAADHNAPTLPLTLAPHP